jgi:pSer/pThr/pTyr-binding forkhead associated (FHA) protein
MAITIVGYPRGSSYLDPFVGVRLTLEGSRLRIGSARGCDVRLPDLGVSPRHATIVGDDVGYNLIDENSEHGTSVGGRYLTAGKPYLLRRDVERVLCGSIWVTLLPRSPLPVDDAPARAAFTRRLLRATLQRLGYRLEATVTAIEGPSRHERLVLPDDLRGETIVFGRAPSAGFRLRDHQASRGHFQIGRDDHDALWVRDLGSTNGTLLAGEPLLPHVDTPWPPGAALGACQSVFVYEDPVARAMNELDRAPHARGILPPFGVELTELAGRPAAPQAQALGPYRGATNG